MDPYRNLAKYYDLEHRDFRDDIDFYLGWPIQDPVLEVGAGTGRVLVPLAQSGLEVWGVDPSEAMISLAVQRLSGASRARTVLGTVDDLPVGTRFATVLLSLNLLWHLSDSESQSALLRSVRSRMRPDGELFIDLSNPFTMADRRAKGDMRQRFQLMREGREVRSWSACYDDEAEQVLHLSLVYDETDREGRVARVSTDLQFQYVYRRELEVLLRGANFDITHVFGGYDRSDYVTDSPNLIVVASPSNS